MKKNYSKPEIMFESFAMSVAIAGGCDTQTNTPTSANGCGLDLSGLMVFMTGMAGCSDIQVDNVGGDGDFNGICYHVPYGTNNLFNS